MNKRRLVEVAYEITYRCNLRCEHCYNAENLGCGEDEMKTPDVIKALDELKFFGVEKLKIGGGEPMMRPDLFDIYAHARELGFEVSYSTNGILVRQNLNKIIEYGVSKMQVSIDGIEEEHDRQRKRPGLFKIAADAVRALADHGVKVNVATTMTRQNRKSLSALVELCGSLGVDKWKVMKYIPTGWNDPLLMSPAEYRETLDELVRLKSEYRSPEVVIAREFNMIHEPADYNDMQCFGGKSFISLKPNGDITPCSYISDWVCGNIVTDGIEKTWNSPKMKAFTADCHDASCAFAEKCRGGCKAISYFLKNKEMACDPYCWVK